MPKKPLLDDIEKELFRTAMRGVKRLKIAKKITVEPPKPSPKVRKKTNVDESADTVPLSDHEYLAPLTSESLVEFKREGIQHKVLRKLRAGQYNVEAVLDMHGMTVAEAKDSLSIFLSQCHQKGLCHVLIIHGKGRTSGNPILKNKLNHWLRDITQVLAFCSAAARDGRSGAMYILLKNKGESVRDT
jgi:DNA-nicking Smr family endonuclease